MKLVVEEAPVNSGIFARRFVSSDEKIVSPKEIPTVPPSVLQE